VATVSQLPSSLVRNPVQDWKGQLSEGWQSHCDLFH